MAASPKQPTLLPLLTQALECDFRGRLKVLLKVRGMIGMYNDIAEDTKACGRLLLAMLAQRPGEWDAPAKSPDEAVSERFSIECLHALGSILWNLTAVLACPTSGGVTEAYLREDSQSFIEGVLPLLSYKREHWNPEQHLRPFFEILNNLSQCPEIAKMMVEQGVIQQMAQCSLALTVVPSIMTLANLVRVASDKKNRMFAFGHEACQRVIGLLPYAMADVNIHSGHYVPAEILLALMGMSENEDNIRSCLAAHVINSESEKFAEVQQRLQFSANELRLLPLLCRLRNPEGLPGLVKYPNMIERTAQLAQIVLLNLSRLQAPLSPLSMHVSSEFGNDTFESSVTFHVPSSPCSTSLTVTTSLAPFPYVDTNLASPSSVTMLPTSPLPPFTSLTPRSPSFMSVCSIPPLDLELSRSEPSPVLSPLAALLSPLPLSRAPTPSTTPLVLETRDYTIMSRMQACSMAHFRALSGLYMPSVITNVLLSYCTPWTDEQFALDFDLDGVPVPLASTEIDEASQELDSLRIS